MTQLLKALKGAQFNREAGLKKYREILLRAEAPQADDVETLREIMSNFVLTPADVEADLRAMAEVAQYEKNIEEASLATGELDRRRTKIEELRAAAQAAKKEVERLQAEADGLWNDGQRRITNANNMRSHIDETKKRYWRAFGLSDPSRDLDGRRQ